MVPGAGLEPAWPCGRGILSRGYAMMPVVEFLLISVAYLPTTGSQCWTFWTSVSHQCPTAKTLL
jgi:hypothetical protein